MLFQVPIFFVTHSMGGLVFKKVSFDYGHRTCAIDSR